MVTFLAIEPCLADTSIGTELTFDSSFKEAIDLKSSADKFPTTDLLPEIVMFTYLSFLTSYTMSKSLIASSCVTVTGTPYITTVFSGSVIFITVSQINVAIITATILTPTLCVNDSLIFIIIFFIAVPSFPKFLLIFCFNFVLGLY